MIIYLYKYGTSIVNGVHWQCRIKHFWGPRQLKFQGLIENYHLVTSLILLPTQLLK